MEADLEQQLLALNGAEAELSPCARPWNWISWRWCGALYT